MPKDKDPPESLAEKADLPEGKTLTGRPVDPATGQDIDRLEAQHFIRCEICGGMFDMRDLTQVIHHDPLKHEFMTDPNWDRLRSQSQ